MLKYVGVVALNILVALGCAAQPTAQHDLKLWYDKPAQKWEEAVPVGSGRLGAMVFGGADSERIQFNEDTLWTGHPRDYVRKGAKDHLAQIRQLIFDGKQEEAANLFRETMISDPKRQKAYQPFGDLRFMFPGHNNVQDYRRELDLDQAIATTTYKVGNTQFQRQVFASYPDNAIVVAIGSSGRGQVSFALKMDSPHKTSQTAASGQDTLVLRGQVLDPIDNTMGLRFESQVKVLAQGGKISVNGDTITVQNADSATLLLVAATSFVNFQDISGDPGAKAQAYLDKLEGTTYATLRDRHVKDHQALFRRVSIDLGTTNAAKLPTDQRVQAAKKSSNPANDTQKNPPMPGQLTGGLYNDPQLAALFFQYGRYMLIGASRPGTQAANLQGVWNELLNPPWESKYTTNINFQMNYWPAELTNLSECHEPFFDMIDDLRISGARTAQEQYGCRGWVLHHNTDLWRGTAPINNIDGMWPTGGAWLCHHLWEHYQYTGDKEFLEKRAYPAMKEASLFFLDFLIKDPKTGWLVTNPSHSPEQGPLNAGPAMDMQLIRALFDYTTEAAGILGVDSELVEQIKQTRKQLVPDQIGKAGELQEWKEDWGQESPGHRHMSPLWGLYPGGQFTEMSDPKLFAAVKRLLEIRGDGSTGWSFVWRIPLWARVGDGEFAYRQLALLMGRRVLPNLFDLCGPFQADGNYGATAGIAEMLMQSHLRNGDEYLIDFLPALPSAWPNGTITGLRTRGGFEANIAWKNGKLTEASLTSTLGNPCQVRYGKHSIRLKTVAGQKIQFGPDLAVVKQ